MYCQHCGKKIPDGAQFCQFCGNTQSSSNNAVVPTYSQQNGIVCPKCGAGNINIQLVQEDVGSRTVTKTKTKKKEVGHGIFWWLFIGWWWWLIDIFLWIFLFIPRLLIHATRKRNYKETTRTISNVKNNTQYRSMCLCPNCGYHWEQR